MCALQGGSYGERVDTELREVRVLFRVGLTEDGSVCSVLSCLLLENMMLTD